MSEQNPSDKQTLQRVVEFPKYRVRLFLSADLAGSTAFKSQAITGLWVTVFKKFYGSFHASFTSNYLKYCKKNGVERDIQENVPKLWKTIGDEVIFVNRVNSCFEVFAFVHSFMDTLTEYGRSLKSFSDTSSLDVKGNAWVASFPCPNQTFMLPDLNGNEEDSSLPSEHLESGADKNPSILGVFEYPTFALTD
jgi:hypothetical protein